MGKKRVAIQKGTIVKKSETSSTKKIGQLAKKKIVSGILYIEASFNNTKACLTDQKGNVLFWSSAGSLGFRGAKKGTPFAASKVGELLGETAKSIGMEDVAIYVKGIGSGREPTIRSFSGHGLEISAIRDRTPVPHNGPRAKKPRRV